MASWNSRLETGVSSAVNAYLGAQRERGGNILPVDLRVVAQAIGNIEVEEREMIPEAAIQASGSKFCIYLQSNFKHRPGQRIRQRFSLAHEIAHTFFFEIRNDELKPIRGAPRGLDLERACHEAAGRILIPERLIPSKIEKERQRITGEDLVRFTRMYDVSLETVLRRLQNHPAVELQDTSFALCEGGLIRFALYPPWLGSILRKPALKTLQSWVRTSDVLLPDWFRASGLEVETLPNGSYVARCESAILSARRVRSGSIDLYEIRRFPPGSSMGEEIEFLSPEGLPSGKVTEASEAPVLCATKPDQQEALPFSPAVADAPTCSECGGLMTRNGSCYKCENCGGTSGCS